MRPPPAPWAPGGPRYGPPKRPGSGKTQISRRKLDVPGRGRAHSNRLAELNASICVSSFLVEYSRRYRPKTLGRALKWRPPMTSRSREKIARISATRRPRELKFGWRGPTGALARTRAAAGPGDAPYRIAVRRDPRL